jgi:hypothetical protein
MNQLIREAPKTPIACTLGAGEVGTQLERWKKLYADAGTERTETDDGLRVRFRRDSAVEHELGDLVAVEIECCTWANWNVEAGAAELILEISSSGDGIPLLHSWLLNDQPVLPPSS